MIPQRRCGRAPPDDIGSPAATFALCLIGAVVIASKALLASDGYLSPDSVNYLSLVENLRAGHGLVTANSGRVPLDYTPFAEWPVGYPMLIYAIGALTGLSSFAASKAISVSLFLGCAALIGRVFPGQGKVLACVMCFAGTLEIFAYTWSEVLFTFLLIALAVLTARVLRDDGTEAGANALVLFACGAGLFLSRYIGAFAVGHIGLLAVIKLWHRQPRYAVLLAATVAALTVLISAYLWHNAFATGFPTGMQRPSATGSAVELASQLFTAVVSEVAVVIPPGAAGWPVQLSLGVIFTLLVGGLGFSAYRHSRQAPRANERIDALCFLWVGLTYLMTIVSMRWFKQFDAFDFRLLDPALVPIFVGIFAVIMGSGGDSTRQACRALVLGAAAMSLLAHAATALVRFDGRGYLAHASEVLKRYAVVPQGSTIVFGDRLAVFLRPDLHIDAPCTEQGEDCGASWGEYLASLTGGRAVFVDINQNALDPDHHSASVRRFVSSQKAFKLVRVR